LTITPIVTVLGITGLSKHSWTN